MIPAAHTAGKYFRDLVRRPGVQELLVIVFLLVTLTTAGEKALGSIWYFTAVVMLICALLLMLIDLRIALFVLLVFFAGYEEYNLASTEAFITGGETGTILVVRIFGVGILDFCLLFFTLPVAIKAWYEWHTRREPLILPYDMLMLPIALLWLYGIVVGAFHIHSATAFAHDVRDLGYILLFWIVVTRIFRTPNDYFLATCAIVGAVFLKTFVFMGRQFTGGGYAYGADYSRTLLGSDTALVGMLFVATIGVIFVFNSMPRKYKAGMVVLVFYIAMVLISGLTRSTYVFTSVAVLFLFYTFRKNIHVSTFIITIVLLVAGSLFFYFMVLSEGIRNLIAYSLSSAFNWFDAVKTYGDLSLGQRVLEFINIWETLSRQGMLLLGLGWGSAWSEVAMHHPLDAGAFDFTEQMTGVHTKAHVDAIQFMLKLGVIGMPLLYYSFFRVFRLGQRSLNRITETNIRWTLLINLVMVIIFIANFIYFARLKFLLAFAFAGIAVISYSQSKNEEHPPGIADPHDA